MNIKIMINALIEGAIQAIGPWGAIPRGFKAYFDEKRLRKLEDSFDILIKGNEKAIESLKSELHDLKHQEQGERLERVLSDIFEGLRKDTFRNTIRNLIDNRDTKEKELAEALIFGNPKVKPDRFLLSSNLVKELHDLYTHDYDTFLRHLRDVDPDFPVGELIKQNANSVYQSFVDVARRRGHCENAKTFFCLSERYCRASDELKHWADIYKYFCVHSSQK